jgi:hypothetical protein
MSGPWEVKQPCGKAHARCKLCAPESYPGRKCEPGCTCERHSDEARDRMRYAQMKSPPSQPDYVRTVEHSRHISEGKTGIPLTPKARVNILAAQLRPEVRASKSAKRLAWLETERGQEVIHRAAVAGAQAAGKARPNKVELAFFSELEAAYPDAIRHHKLGRNIVDAYVPSLRTAFEVDGCVWHECPEHGKGWFPERQANEPIRDAQIKNNSDALLVIHVWEHDIRKDH